MPHKTNTEATVTSPVPAYKAFNQDMTCRGFQFAAGQTYRHEGPVKACESGFHAITGHPLALFKYYPPASARIFRVEISGAMDSDDDGEKTAAEILSVGKEIGLTEIILEAAQWVKDRARPVDGDVTDEPQTSVTVGRDGGAATATGTGGAATATGTGGAATATGTGGAATASGEGGAATATGTGGAATATGTGGAATASGDRGTATATGTGGAATATGTGGAATATGTGGAATASGWQGAATASGWQGAATASGEGGAATASGDRGTATASGWQGAATASGEGGAATATGFQGKARAADGNAIFLAERDGPAGRILHVWAGIAGNDGIKPMVFYRLIGGQPVEVP